MNALRRLYEMGILSQEDMPENDLAALVGRMPQPRYDIEPMEMNTMRVESGPEAGKVIPMDFAPQQQPDGQRMKLAGLGGGIYSDLGEVEAAAPQLDYSRPGIEIAGKGKGYYGKDGNIYLKDGNGGLTKVVTGYDREASWDALNRHFARRGKEQALERGELEMEQTRLQNENLRTPRPKEAPAGYRWKADGSMERVPGGPADDKVNEDERKKAASGADTLQLLNAAEPLLAESTESLMGTGLDKFLGAFGGSTKGAEAVAKLQTIAGQLVAKMPRMEGPQSNYDVKLYKEMAGQLADSTVPAEQRMAALEQIRALNSKYGQPSGGMPQIKSEAERAALPAGTAYIGPDGKKRRKQ